VSKVLGPDGKVLYDAGTDPGQRVLSSDVTACETDLLRGVVTGGTGTNAQLADDRPVAGKTGTTDGRSDANFLGFTPQRAAFVWHGNATAQVPGAGFGGDVPARIFKRFMDEALAGAIIQFRTRADLRVRKLRPVTDDRRRPRCRARPPRPRSHLRRPHRNRRLRPPRHPPCRPPFLPPSPTTSPPSD
jgi:membrane peptidoglycan carboxypeptidase